MVAMKLCLILSISLLLATVVHIAYYSFDKREASRMRIASLKSRTPFPHDGVPFADNESNLFWFMQITDLHFSTFSDSSRVSDFLNFCTEIVSTIQPELLSVSGDLTDSRGNVYIRSDQSISEWIMYSQILLKSGILNRTRVLDIRGNHDMFGVISRNHTTDLFSKHSVSGRRHLRSYSHVVRKPYGVYSFVSLDATPITGLKFPLNFFGQLSTIDAQTIRTLASEAQHSNQTFWFAHYPTSTIVSAEVDLRTILGDSSFAYFCGHLHTLLHLVPRMYTLQPQGYLELELGDWKIDRYFRVVAVDHDLVSFVDIQIPPGGAPVWPVIIVTNPKNSDFLLPHKEPVYRIGQSKHIRMLVWSTSSIAHVTVFIDNHYQGNASSAVHLENEYINPFFTLPWNATTWADHHVHILRVEATDSTGSRRVLTQPFIVTGDPSWNFEALATFVLQTDHTFNARLIFYISDLVLCCLLIILRFLPFGFTRRVLSDCRLLRGLHRFTCCTTLSFPLFYYLLYLCVGPIFMGFLVGYHFGVVFSAGIFIGGSFVLESLTYVYEIIQLGLIALVYLPYLLWYCGGYTKVNVQTPCPPDSSPQCASDDPCSQSLLTVVRIRSASRTFGTIPIPLFCHALIFSLLQSVFVVATVAIPYGLVAAILSPGRLICIGLSWYIASKLTHALDSCQ